MRLRIIAGGLVLLALALLGGYLLMPAPSYGAQTGGAGAPITRAEPFPQPGALAPIQHNESKVSGPAPRQHNESKVSAPSPDDATCLACHNNPRLLITLGDGQQLTLHVDPAEYAASVHAGKLGCQSCHGEKTGYPHQPTKAADVRAYASGMSGACSNCHQGVADLYRSSVHGAAVMSGNSKAPLCVDCHSAHSVKRAFSLVQSTTCAKCHVAVTDTYETSVHGKLVSAGRIDAATCVDCHTNTRSTHGLQAVAAPGSVLSAKHVPETCGRCHTRALETYESTIHGKAVRLGVAANAPTCVDCHGAYGVQRVHGAEAPVTKAKLAETCAKCHPGASENFLSGWMGHEEASPSWFPMVFITERFLFFLTTSVVAFGIVHVELDILRWVVNRRKKAGQKKEEENESEHQDR
ncbi:MAG: cytochrome c3 family protein [Chloroflexi bacterium]|nr:cytochrome c3 family protein [Chloroflexota bacterium]